MMGETMTFEKIETFWQWLETQPGFGQLHTICFNPDDFAEWGDIITEWAKGCPILVGLSQDAPRYGGANIIWGDELPSDFQPLNGLNKP